MERKKFKRKATITKELLQEMWNTEFLRENRYAQLEAAISDLTGGDFRCTVYDVEADNAIDNLMKALLGNKLYDDWEYLVGERPRMKDGEKFAVEDRVYMVADVDSLWDYWESENLI